MILRITRSDHPLRAWVESSVRVCGVHSPRMRSRFTHPRRLPLIAPSILSADFGFMVDECRHVLDNGADLLHLDVMDGHFVPNLTMGPDMCRWLRRHLPDAFLDVHLMVTDPERFIRPFSDAGANHLTFHAEVVPADRVAAVADAVRREGMTAGLAINPPTPVEQILECITEVDLVLVMSVNPGFAGQAFIRETLKKATAIADELQPTQRLEMDGGISPDNARSAIDAGCDVLVAASAVFGARREQRGAVIESLRGQAR